MPLPLENRIMNSATRLTKDPVARLGTAVRRGLRFGLTAGTLCLALPSYAATATGVMTVTATVAASCVVGTSALAFGSATSAAIQAGNVDVAGNVIVNCTTGSAYTVALGIGAGLGATMASRKLTSGASLLNYSIYTATARTTVWGDGTATSVTVAGTGSGADQSIPAYGRIFSGQIVPALTYTDTISVTVTY